MLFTEELLRIIWKPSLCFFPFYHLKQKCIVLFFQLKSRGVYIIFSVTTLTSIVNKVPQTADRHFFPCRKVMELQGKTGAMTNIICVFKTTGGFP